MRRMLKPSELALLLGLKTDTIWHHRSREGMYKTAIFRRARLMIPVDDPDVPEHARRTWLEMQGKAIPESGREIGSLVKRIDKIATAIERNSALLKALLRRIGTTGK